jgi:hypothetical protein
VPSTSSGGNWSQALAFAGDVAGTMTQVVDDPANQSECTGRNSRFGEVWVSNLFGQVGDQVYEVLVRVPAYRGPGAYHAADATIQVARLDRSYVWQTSAGDAATFTVDPSEETGGIEATLTELHNDTTKLRLTGRWSCAT